MANTVKRVKETIKVGYLPLYIKLYDDSNPNYRDPMVNYMNMLIKMLETQGIEVVQADDVCRIKPEFEKAVKKFNKEKVTAVITQHLAYSPALESLASLLKLDCPIIVFDTTQDYELLKVANYEGRISANHGIHGVQDMCNLLLRNNKPYYLCCGHALHSEVVSEVVGMCRAAKVAENYKNMIVGSVGGSFTSMGDFLVSDEEYKSSIGCTVKYMTPEVVKKYVKKVTKKEVEDEIAYDKANFNVKVVNEEAYKAATLSGLAVRKWMEDEKIGSATVNFLTLDICGLPKMPFVECCKIMQRYKGYAGEGDVLTAGLVGSLMNVYPNTQFTEMFCPDWEKDVILLSHMGESNPNLAAWKPLVTDCPFNYNSCGDTVAMYNCYREGKAVIVNLAPTAPHGKVKKGENYNLIVTEVDIIPEGLENGAYGKATQGWMKPCKPLNEFLKEYSYAGGTHHSAMVYDVDIEEIKAFGKMMGFNVVEIK